ncbi:MAG TPA: hypothetical protein VJ437_04315 [Acidiferrobacterales bacterium]|nr:hypothetical protein [Acidiferrobacterales bacterium]
MQRHKAGQRLVVVWMVAGVLLLGHVQTNAAAADQKKNIVADVTRLPFSEVSALTGGLAIAADGRTAAHVAANGEIVLWDPASGKTLETLSADGKQPSAVALSPAGDLVAVGYADAQLVLWSRQARKVVRELGGHLHYISALAFSADGRMLASGGSDATAQVWEVDNGRRVRIFDSRYGDPVGSSGGNVIALGFSGDGRVMVVNEWYRGQYEPGRGTSLWDVNEGIEISTRHVTPPNTGNIVGVGQAIGGGGWLLTYTGRDGMVIERLDDCGVVPRQLPAGGYADSVIADAQGRWVAASENHEVKFFGLTGNPQARSVEIPGRTIALVAHPDGRSVLALLAKVDAARNVDYKNATIYRVAVPEPLLRLPLMAVKHGATYCPPSADVRKQQDFHLPESIPDLPVAARLVPTREMVASPTPRDLYFAQDGNLHVRYDGGVTEWDLRTQRVLRARFKSSYGFSGYLFLRLRDGWAVKDEVSTLNNMQTGKPLLRFKDHGVQDGQDGLSVTTVVTDQDTDEVYRIAPGRVEHYAADGRRLPDVVTGGGKPIILATRNGRLAVLDENYRVQVGQMKPGAKPITFGPLPREGNCDIDQLTLSGDGRYLQTGFNCGDGGMIYWVYEIETAKWAPTGFFAAPLPARANRAVIQDDRLNRLAILDLAKGALIARLPRHRSRNKHGDPEPLLAAISDDGRLVASASPDGLVRVWDINTRQILGEAKLGGALKVVAFDSPGRQLAAGQEDGEVVVFRLPAASGS